MDRKEILLMANSFLFILYSCVKEQMTNKELHHDFQLWPEAGHGLVAACKANPTEES